MPAFVPRAEVRVTALVKADRALLTGLRVLRIESKPRLTEAPAKDPRPASGNCAWMARVD